MIIQPTTAQIIAGDKAGRAALDNYSSWDSSMVPDGALDAFVRAVITAAINVPGASPVPAPKPSPASQTSKGS
jgi:hypothetical protein